MLKQFGKLSKQIADEQERHPKQLVSHAYRPMVATGNESSSLFSKMVLNPTGGVGPFSDDETVLPGLFHVQRCARVLANLEPSACPLGIIVSRVIQLFYIACLYMAF